MGAAASPFTPVPTEDFNELKSTTRFSRGEIEYLYTRFRELGKRMERKRFIIKSDFDFPSYAFHSLILNEMFGEKYRITFIEFAKFLNIFKTDNRATPEEKKALRIKKLKLLFSMYDVNKDGDLSKYDLLEIVHKLFSHYATLEKIVEIVNVIMKEMSRTNVNRILFVDFCEALEPFDMDHLAIRFPVL